MIINLNSKSIEKTKEIGFNIGSSLKGNELILLIGELGAGKTLMTKGIARGLEIPESEIVSPTFTLQNSYYSTKTDNFVHHFDLYRIGETVNEIGIISPEIDECLDESIAIVEWAQYLDRSYFKLNNLIKIYIDGSDNNENKRIIKVETELKSIADTLFSSYFIE